MSMSSSSRRGNVSYFYNVHTIKDTHEGNITTVQVKGKGQQNH